jgi:CHAT domain-containing protein/tetratricopeptide (TPR) repeat protein
MLCLTGRSLEFVHGWAVRSIISLIVCAPMLTFAQSPDETALRALVDNFFVAYQKADIEAVQPMLDVKAPDYAAIRQQIQKVFADNERIEIKDLIIRKVTLDGAKATMRVSLEMSTVDKKTKAAGVGFGKMDFTLRAVKKDGAWKVWTFLSSVEDMASALVAATTDQERKLLLASEPELVTIKMQRVLVRQGNRFLAQENYQRAIAVYNLAINIAEQLGDKGGIVGPLSNIGLINKAQGNYAQALENFERSMRLADELGDKALFASVLNNAGLVRSSQGNYARALEIFQKSLALSEEMGNKPVIARSMNNLGMVHYLQGNYPQALQYYQKSLILKEQLNDKTGMITGLNNIGLAHYVQANYAQALDYYQRSLTVVEGLGNKELLASILVNIGQTHVYQKNFEIALKTYQRALALAEELGTKDLLSEVLNDIGDFYYSQGDFKKALEFAERAGTMGKQIGSPERTWRACTVAGKAYRALNRLDDARRAFEEAIGVIETIRGQLGGNEQQQEQFFENKLSPYHGMIELLIAQNKMDEALAFAERAKARMLLDVLRSGKVNVAKAMTAHEQEQERRFNNDLVSINNQISRDSLGSQPASSLADLRSQLQKARLAYEAFQTNLYLAHPELKVQRGQALPVTTEEIAALMPDAKSALLEYVVTDEKVYLFVSTRKAEENQTTLDLKTYLLDIKQKDLIRDAERFRKLLATRNLDFSESARGLYDLLIRPAQAQISGKTALVIVPDEVLWELPFQALQSAKNRFLLEDHAISYAPSLTVLREMIKLRGRRADKRSNSLSLLAMGNPALGSKTSKPFKPTLTDDKLDPLPEAENEVKTLAKLYGAARSKVYVGTEAREDRLKAQASNFMILHLATHGILNDVSPMYSQIVLSQGDSSGTEDGLLEAWEIIKLDLRADLVVLSACETARGRVGAGEGVIGLTWALFVAGSPTTVVGQWKVDSASTTQLMLEFHRNLKNEINNEKREIGTARALQQAAMKLLRSNEYRHPFYWAGFVVVGDGF